MSTATMNNPTTDETMSEAMIDTDPGVKNDKNNEGRRRNIDPTTCERDYSYDEIEFMQALDEYKRDAKRMFPTCSEILEVLRKLGYTKDVSLPQS